eukprot:3211549-Amphidinium_carterae.1
MKGPFERRHRTAVPWTARLRFLTQLDKVDTGPFFWILETDQHKRRLSECFVKSQSPSAIGISALYL